MKKSKLSAGLVTSFIAAMSLGACSSAVSGSKDTIVDFKGYNDQNLAVITDEIYEDYKKSSSGISAYYNQVIEVLIRNAFAKNEKDKTVLPGVRKTYTQIVNEAKNSVKSDKQSARESADTNGTSYKSEWQSILKGKGVKDEAELLQYYIYQLEKDVIEDWYYDTNEQALRSEYIGVDETGASTSTDKASSRYPYHIRHILVKVEDGASDFARGTISSSQAKLLSETIQRIAEGKLSFGEIAKQYSEDGSASSYGDVGIVTSDASSGTLKMVNEFQLGIYAYDGILSGRANNEVLNEGLGFSKKLTTELYQELTKDTNLGADTSVSNTIKKLGLGEVPYSKVVEMGLAADVEDNNTTGLKVGDGQTALYPRNIIWNKYFNRHNAFVITNRTAPTYVDTKDATKATLQADLAAEQVKQNNLRVGDADSSYVAAETVSHYKDTRYESIKYEDLANFQPNAALAGNKADFRVLTDGAEDVIIGVRSQYGIHLMVVEKSAYDFNDGEGNNVSLDQYYTTAVPGDEDYPVDTLGKDKKTYVNFIDSVNKSEYNSRADTVRSAIKGFDSTYDYRLYDELTAAGDEAKRQQIFDKDSNGYKLLEQIDGYIALQREKNLYDQEEGLAKVWRTYLELINEQNNYRVDIPSRGEYRLVPEGCKIRFYSNQSPIDAKEYEEGGACYVKN